MLTWRDRYPDEVTCVRCLEVRDKGDLDRLLWCESCREAARRRARLWGWLAGGALAALLAVWIWGFVRPSPDLIIGGWIATVVAALWIGAKVGREIAYGVMRFKNARAVDAVPPVRPRERGSEESSEESEEAR